MWLVKHTPTPRLLWTLSLMVAGLNPPTPFTINLWFHIFILNNYTMSSKFFGNKNDNKNNNKNTPNKTKSNNSKKSGGAGVKKAGRGK